MTDKVSTVALPGHLQGVNSESYQKLLAHELEKEMQQRRKNSATEKLDFMLHDSLFGAGSVTTASQGSKGQLEVDVHISEERPEEERKMTTEQLFQYICATLGPGDANDEDQQTKLAALTVCKLFQNRFHKKKVVIYDAVIGEHEKELNLQELLENIVKNFEHPWAALAQVAQQWARGHAALLKELSHQEFDDLMRKIDEEDDEEDDEDDETQERAKKRFQGGKRKLKSKLERHIIKGLVTEVKESRKKAAEFRADIVRKFARIKQLRHKATRMSTLDLDAANTWQQQAHDEEREIKDLTKLAEEQERIATEKAMHLFSMRRENGIVAGGVAHGERYISQDLGPSSIPEHSSKGEGIMLAGGVVAAAPHLSSDLGSSDTQVPFKSLGGRMMTGVAAPPDYISSLGNAPELTERRSGIPMISSKGEEPRWHDVGGSHGLGDKFNYISDGPAEAGGKSPKEESFSFRAVGGLKSPPKFEYISDGGTDENVAKPPRQKSHYLNSNKPAISKERLQELHHAPRPAEKNLLLGPSGRMSMRGGGKYDKKLAPLSFNKGPYEDPSAGGFGRHTTIGHNLRPLRSPRNLPGTGSRRSTQCEEKEAEEKWKALGNRDSVFNPTRGQMLPPLNASEKDPKCSNPHNPQWNSSTHAGWDVTIRPHHVGALHSKPPDSKSGENLEATRTSSETPGHGKGNKAKKGDKSHIDHGSAKWKGPWRQGRPRARSFGSYEEFNRDCKTVIDEDLLNALANDAAALEVHGRHNKLMNLQHAHDLSVASDVERLKPSERMMQHPPSPVSQTSFSPHKVVLEPLESPIKEGMVVVAPKNVKLTFGAPSSTPPLGVKKALPTKQPPKSLAKQRRQPKYNHRKSRSFNSYHDKDGTLQFVGGSNLSKYIQELRETPTGEKKETLSDGRLVTMKGSDVHPHHHFYHPPN